MSAPSPITVMPMQHATTLTVLTFVLVFMDILEMVIIVQVRFVIIIHDL